MKLYVAGLVIALSFALGLQAAPDAPTGAAATAPSTQPGVSPETVGRLIKQLGDEDFSVREQASESLNRIGRAALPALKEAANADDAETRSRVNAIIAKIEGRNRKPNTPETGRAGDPEGVRSTRGRGIAFRRAQLRVANGAKDIAVTEDDRKITIHEDANGIAISITSRKDGKETTEEYKAENADELKEKHPEVFKLYEKHGGSGAGVEVQIIGGMGVIRAMPVQPREPEPAGKLPQEQKQPAKEPEPKVEPQAEQEKAEPQGKD